MRIEVAIVEVVRAAEVNITDAGGTTITIIHATRPANVPWSAVTGIPENLCFFQITDDQLFVEIKDLAGTLITKVPYIPA